MKSGNWALNIFSAKSFNSWRLHGTMKLPNVKALLILIEGLHLLNMIIWYGISSFVLTAFMLPIFTAENLFEDQYSQYFLYTTWDFIVSLPHFFLLNCREICIWCGIFCLLCVLIFLWYSNVFTSNWLWNCTLHVLLNTSVTEGIPSLLFHTPFSLSKCYNDERMTLGTPRNEITCHSTILSFHYMRLY